MSDVVERLALARDMVELERAAADAIDEIERLKKELEAMRYDRNCFESLAEIHHTECERLRDILNRIRGVLNDEYIH
jgi:hypothetical protein